MPREINIDYQMLYDKYITEKKSCLQISKELGISPNCIRKNLEANKIHFRSKIKDLTGQKFNMVSVLSYSETCKNTGRSKWNCRCDCGKNIILKGHSLKTGQITNCGCKRLERINLSGQKFGKLTVIKRNGSSNHGQARWMCECECEKIVTINSGSLRQGLTTSCGCNRRNEFFKGQQINKLTLVEIYDSDKHGNIRWRCKCECGEESIVCSSSLNNGKVDGCAKCAIKNRSGSKSSCFNGYQEITGTFWGNIKKSSRTRSLEFSITIKQAWELFLKQNRKCALSGLFLTLNTKANSHTGTASLDRIDSSKGYTIDNVQWVHKDINIMKSDHSDKEFINYCKLVANHNPL